MVYENPPKPSQKNGTVNASFKKEDEEEAGKS